MKKIRHILFDLDRTLWDFESNARAALTDIFYKYKLEGSFRDPSEFFDIYNRHNERLWAGYRKGELKKEVLRSKRFELTLQEKKLKDRNLAAEVGNEYLLICPRKNLLFEGTLETLEYLSGRYSLHILTNGFRKTQESKLKNCNIHHFFTHLFTSETIGFHKPHPGIFQHVVSSLNAKKEECIMIGDDPEVDIKGAGNFGLVSVLFDPHGKYPHSDADFSIHKLTDLKKIL